MKKMKFNMDKAMRNLGYLTLLSSTMFLYTKIFVDMVGRLCS